MSNNLYFQTAAENDANESTEFNTNDLLDSTTEIFLDPNQSFTYPNQKTYPKPILSKKESNKLPILPPVGRKKPDSPSKIDSFRKPVRIDLIEPEDNFSTSTQEFPLFGQNLELK